MNVRHEEKNIITVDKSSGEIVQGDKTGDNAQVETVRH